MSVNNFMWSLFLFAFLVGVAPFSRANIEIIPEVNRAQTQGVEYLTQEKEQILVSTKNELCKIVWDADIQETGNYWLFIGYSTGKEESDDIKMKWTVGKNIFTDHLPRNEGVIKRFLKKWELKKGKQTITLSFKGKDSLRLTEMKLIKDPLTELSPFNGKIELLARDAYFEGCFLNKEDDCFICVSDQAAITWNLDIPREQRYSLSLVYATSPYEKFVSFDVYIGTQKMQIKLPPTSNFGNYRESQMAFLSFPAGKYPICIKKTGGWMDIMKAVLVHSEEQDKAIDALQLKNRLGLGMKEFELLYGQGARTDYMIDRRGGREDIDWKVYQGIQGHIESSCWNKPGLLITAAFYKGRCVAINVKPEKISPKSSREIVTALLPETVFDSGRGDTLYSRDKKYKMQYWGDSVDIKASALLQELRESEPAATANGQSVAVLKTGDIILGASLSQLQQLWGAGRVREMPIDDLEIDKPNDKSDKDWTLFHKIKPELNLQIWTYPDKNDLNINAIFWKDRCVSIHMWARDRFTPIQIMEKIKDVLPGVTFGAIPRGKEENFTIYSTNPNKEYKVQGWGDYIDIKSPGLVNKIMKEENDRLKKTALVFIKKLQSIGTPVYGKTLEELDKLLGDSQKTTSADNGKALAVWTFPDSDMEFQCTYNMVNGKNLCDQFRLVDKNKSLTAPVALALCKRLIAPNPMRNMLEEEMRTWFTVTSMDKEKRFLVKWYNDKKTGSTLSITDQSVGEYVEQSSTHSMKRNL